MEINTYDTAATSTVKPKSCLQTLQRDVQSALERDPAARSALEVVHTVLHAGGKFERSAYKVSGGLHGVGASVVNALSEEFEVEVHREGKLWYQHYERGIPKTKVEERGAAKTSGTKTTFSPDPKIFQEVKFKYEIIARYLREMAYLNGGLKVRLRDERTGKEEEFHYEGGIAEFVESLAEGNEALHDVIFFKGDRDAIDVEIADLAGDGSAERAGQGADRQVDPGDLDLVYRAPPHSMQRAQRKRRPGLDPVVHRIPIQRLGRRNPRGSSYIHKCPAPRIPQAVRGSS